MTIEPKKPAVFLPTFAWIEYALDPARMDNPGWCVLCGTEAEGVEPDARAYECEECLRRGVYGPEQLLMRGAFKKGGEA